MMNNIKYAPILKWKSAEKNALKGLRENQKDRIIPVLEIVPQNTDKISRVDIEKYLLKEAEDIFKYWGDGRLFYIDFSLFYPESKRRVIAEKTCANLYKLHLDAVPIINFSADSDDYKENLVNLIKNKCESRLCIRMTAVDLLNNKISLIEIEKFIAQENLDRSKVSILIDLKEKVNETTYERAFHFISNASGYREVIIAGGVFPKDMAQFKLDDEQPSMHYRGEWKLWSKNIKKFTGPLQPIFGDYTARHPIYDATIMKFQSTATIKYTIEDAWAIYKGRQSKYGDYVVNARILVREKGSLFYGEEYSAGDKFIYDKNIFYDEYVQNLTKNKKVSGVGNTTQWLSAMINHHISVVVDQLSRKSD